MKRLAKSYGKSPSNEDIRESYYNSRKYYRKIIKTKKESFFLKLCLEILDGKEINWDKLKKLKGSHQKRSTLDAFNFINFSKYLRSFTETKVSRVQDSIP